MANTPQDFSVDQTFSSVTEDTELYLTTASETLASGDLVPNTAGDVMPVVDRDISRKQLHNGSEIFTDNGESAQDMNFTVSANRGNAVLDKIHDAAFATGSNRVLKANAFARDGRGYSFEFFVRQCAPTSEGDFEYRVAGTPRNITVLTIA